MKAVVVAPDDEAEQALFDAADACPTQAIYLFTRTGKPLYP
jgi:ferredoxin